MNILDQVRQYTGFHWHEYLMWGNLLRGSILTGRKINIFCDSKYNLLNNWRP